MASDFCLCVCGFASLPAHRDACWWWPLIMYPPFPPPGIDEDDALAKALALSLEPPSNPALSDRTASAARLVLAGNDGGEDDTPMAMATSPSPATLASAATSLPDMPTTTSTPAPTGRPAAMDSAESQDQELARALAMSLEQIDASSETGSTSPLGPDAKRHKSSSDVSSASATAMAISSPSAAATGMDDDLAKAMALSMQESNSPATAPSSSATVGGLDDDLAKAMALSMQTHPAAASTAASGGGLDALSAAAAAVNDSTTSFEEEQFARIMAESAAAAGVAGPADSSYEEEQMKRALAASLIPDSGAAAVSQIFSFSHYNGLHPPSKSCSDDPPPPPVCTATAQSQHSHSTVTAQSQSGRRTTLSPPHLTPFTLAWCSCLCPLSPPPRRKRKARPGRVD